MLLKSGLFDVYNLLEKLIYVVTDFKRNALFRISVENDQLKCCSRVMWALELWRPSEIQVDLSGNLLVADSGHFVQMERFSSPLQGLVQLDLLLDVTVSAAEFIALLDLYGRVSVF